MYKIFGINGTEASVRILIDESGLITGLQLEEKNFYANIKREHGTKLKHWNRMLIRATNHLLIEDLEEYFDFKESLKNPFDRYIVQTAEKNFLEATN